MLHSQRKECGNPTVEVASILQARRYAAYALYSCVCHVSGHTDWPTEFAGHLPADEIAFVACLQHHSFICCFEIPIIVQQDSSGLQLE